MILQIWLRNKVSLVPFEVIAVFVYSNSSLNIGAQSPFFTKRDTWIRAGYQHGYPLCPATQGCYLEQMQDAESEPLLLG